MTRSPDLAAAIERLKTFRGSWNDGGEIDDVSHLTVDDLDTILAAVAEDTVIDKLGDFA